MTNEELLSQSIEQALLVERLTKSLELLSEKEGSVNILYPNGVQWMSVKDFVQQVLSQSPPTGIGAKALDALRVIFQLAEESYERRVIIAAASFTEEEINQILGVE